MTTFDVIPATGSTALIARPTGLSPDILKAYDVLSELWRSAYGSEVEALLVAVPVAFAAVLDGRVGPEVDALMWAPTWDLFDAIDKAEARGAVARPEANRWHKLVVRYFEAAKPYRQAAVAAVEAYRAAA